MSPPALERIDPASLGAPRGYSNGVLGPAGGRVLFVAGQVGWDGEQRVVDGGFAAQFEQALANVLAVVREAGGTPEHVARLTVYVTALSAYRAATADLGERWRRLMGRHYPAMALVEVKGLLEPGALVEIEGTALLPAEDRA